MTPFTIVTKNIKYLGMTLTKQVKNLFDKKVKSQKKEIKELRRWKNVPSSGISMINRVKYAISQSFNLQVQCKPDQNSNSILHRVRKRNSQILVK